MKYIGAFFILFSMAVLLVATEFVSIKNRTDAEQSIYDNLSLGVPSFNELIIIDRKSFAVGYSPRYHVPLWISYILTDNEIKIKIIKRSNHFKRDSEIADSTCPRDYEHTGYDRGHLAPCADLRFSVDSMTESFFMSNIVPQLPDFNRKSWKHLENAIRINVLKEKKLAIVAGVIFYPKRRIEYLKNEIAIPHGFFKVILDLTPPCKMIGFIFDHNEKSPNFINCACSVDTVEAQTGLNFFNFLPPELEKTLEKTFCITD